MTALPLQKSFRSHVPGQSTRPAHPVSQTELLDQASDTVEAASAQVIKLRPIDSREFRIWFAAKFAEYLRSRYDRPELLCAHFGVRASTAWNWWNGDSRASGDSVALAFLTFPDAQAWFLTEWQER